MTDDNHIDTGPQKSATEWLRLAHEAKDGGAAIEEWETLWAQYWRALERERRAA